MKPSPRILPFLMWTLAVMFYPTGAAGVSYKEVKLPSVVNTVAALAKKNDWPIKVIAFLGNGGGNSLYASTRHNAGTMACDRLIEAWQPKTATKSGEGPFTETVHWNLYKYGFGSSPGEVTFKTEPGTYRTSDGEVMIAVLHKRIVLIVHPLFDINQSGPFIAKILSELGVDSSSLAVVYDEIDALPGAFRIKFSGGKQREDTHKGHGGILSIREALGPQQQKFARLRIGIGRQSTARSLAEHVTANFDPAELEKMEPAFKNTIEALSLWVADTDPGETASRTNLR